MYEYVKCIYVRMVRMTLVTLMIAIIYGNWKTCLNTVEHGTLPCDIWRITRTALVYARLPSEVLAPIPLYIPTHQKESHL
jgi:hypothetical protein